MGSSAWPPQPYQTWEGGVERPWTRAPQGEDTMRGDLERWPVGNLYNPSPSKSTPLSLSLMSHYAVRKLFLTAPDLLPVGLELLQAGDANWLWV